MDPNAAWTEFLEEVARQDRRAAAERLLTLQQWIERGGFPPRRLCGNIDASSAAIIEGFRWILLDGGW